MFVTDIHSDFDVNEHPLIDAADIVHLHWTANFLNWQSFFASVARPIVWTLHDMNPFSGIFHYGIDADRAGSDLVAIDRKVLQQKSRYMASSNLHIVAPSRWLTEQSRSSDLFGRFPHTHIPYGLDTSVFRPRDRQLARSVFELPEDKRVLLMVAESLEDYRKGGDLLRDALAGRPLDESWMVAAVGRGSLMTGGYPVRSLGVIGDPRLMALAYAAADMTVVSSRQDNSPNTVLESLCCGTPVVATPAGGTAEPIVSPRDGCIASAVDVDGLAVALSGGNQMCRQNGFDASAIATAASLRFDAAIQAERYRELYNDLNETFEHK